MIQKISILFLFLNVSVFSTTFIPLSLDKQLEDANGVLRAKFSSLEYKKVSNDRIITEATFKIVESIGIKQSEIINKNNFKVIYPGGKWQDLDYRVSGAPSFKPNEEALLILKKTSMGYAVKGLGMGKYKIIETEDGEFYQSSVFPKHPSLGRITEDDFDSALIRKFGADLQKVKSDKFVNIPVQKEVVEKNKSGRFPASVERGPAQVELDSTKEASQSSNPIWIVVLFSLLGAISVYTIRRSKGHK
ncbi:hypothetical protein [Halobacteriovorax marinus]|uniref:hypothetical protein n=1 Tax=Halobacteriovorax marinus TaxID=97084 RepID=UPI003A905721